jgi:hypothetical protein
MAEAGPGVWSALNTDARRISETGEVGELLDANAAGSISIRTDFCGLRHSERQLHDVIQSKE